MILVLYRVLRYAMKSKRGRRLLMLGALSGMRLARSPRARAAYINAWKIATNPQHRKRAAKLARSAGGKARRR